MGRTDDCVYHTNNDIDLVTDVDARSLIKTVRFLNSFCVSRSTSGDIAEKESQLELTGWTNVNLLYFPDSIEIASLQGLTL